MKPPIHIWNSGGRCFKVIGEKRFMTAVHSYCEGMDFELMGSAVPTSIVRKAWTRYQRRSRNGSLE